MSNISIEEYKKKAPVVESTTESTNDVTTDSTDYYEMSKNQEYVTLLDKEIELENARSNALKLTNNQLAAQGMASQGYGSSQMSGIYGRYLNAYENANQNYQASIKDLSYQEHQEELANANDRFGSVTTMMTQASNMEQLNSILSDYQYGTVDSEGNFIFGDKPSGMSDDDWYQMKYYYNLQKSMIEENNQEYATTYGDKNSWMEASYVDGNGVSRNVASYFVYESNNLWTNINNGVYTYGTTIRMQNGSGDVIYVQWTRNGLKIVDENTYSSSEKKDSLTWGENVGK